MVDPRWLEQVRRTNQERLGLAGGLGDLPGSRGDEVLRQFKARQRASVAQATGLPILEREPESPQTGWLFKAAAAVALIAVLGGVFRGGR